MFTNDKPNTELPAIQFPLGAERLEKCDNIQLTTSLLPFYSYINSSVSTTTTTPSFASKALRLLQQ
jgi:hypothetical protein